MGCVVLDKTYIPVSRWVSASKMSSLVPLFLFQHDVTCLTIELSQHASRDKAQQTLQYPVLDAFLGICAQIQEGGRTRGHLGRWRGSTKSWKGNHIMLQVLFTITANTRRSTQGQFKAWAEKGALALNPATWTVGCLWKITLMDLSRSVAFHKPRSWDAWGIQCLLR